MVGRISKYKYNPFKLSKTSKNIHFLRIKGHYFTLSGFCVSVAILFNWFSGVPIMRRIIEQNNLINKNVTYY